MNGSPSTQTNPEDTGAMEALIKPTGQQGRHLNTEHSIVHQEAIEMKTS